MLLGVIVLAGLALGGLGLLAVGGRYWPWSGAFHVRAGFARAQGVEVGTRVRVQGVDAGEVEAIDLPEQPGADVVLRLRLDGRMRNLVRANAVAAIVSEGMVGGKVVEIDPGSAPERVGDGDLIATRPSADLTDVLAQVSGTLKGIRGGQGTLGKLATDPEGYNALVGMLKQGQQTMASVQRDADALKKVPFVGGYVGEDPTALLVRPDCERNRWCFASGDLFEPGRAVLTAAGRQRLDELGPKINGFRQKGTEVVVVSYADDREGPAEVAPALTYQRSQAVCYYLKDHFTIQRVGWIGSRKVTALGMGLKPPPAPEKEPPPASRVEVLVFVPQG
jgi:phospholipid/cholesterol/gamma-HCH transport system substrate-binding protein